VKKMMMMMMTDCDPNQKQEEEAAITSRLPHHPPTHPPESPFLHSQGDMTCSQIDYKSSILYIWMLQTTKHPNVSD
jgi:hypothetical protein